MLDFAQNMQETLPSEISPHDRVYFGLKFAQAALGHTSLRNLIEYDVENAMRSVINVGFDGDKEAVVNALLPFETDSKESQ